MTAMAAARRASKGTSGGHGKGAEPPGVGCVIIKGRVRLRSANDNALIHGGWKALWVAVGIVLTLGAWVLVLMASS
jgi:hypothetical protein